MGIYCIKLEGCSDMKNISGKLVKIMDECGFVQKNGNNDFHHYKYATSADVLEKVNTSLVKHNVCSVIVPELISMVDVINNKGNTEHLATVRITNTLIDADSGESLCLVGLGSGQDAGDKAVMKAQTASIKYAYLLSLAISTNDDPEADSRTDEMNNRGSMSIDSSKAKDDAICSDCGLSLTQGVIKVSTTKYGKPLCMQCQKKQSVA